MDVQEQTATPTVERADRQEAAKVPDAPAPTVPPTPGDAPPKRQSSGAARLVSLDAFRGLTILGMLLVNNIAAGEATPRHLQHAGWNRGIHFADLVFPWFLFIVGVAIPFSVASARKRGTRWWQYAGKVFSRTATLLFLGCLVDSSIAHRPVVGLGVLQLIGLAYAVAAFLVFAPLPWRLLIAVGLLVSHWAALRFIPVPGVGPGAFTPADNLIAYLNQAYLARFHLNGLVSVVPTSALVLLGTAVADLLRRERLQPLIKIGILTVGGLLLLLVGWLWSRDLPFNKPVWTASYIVFSGGWACLVLAGFYALIDVGLPHLRQRGAARGGAVGIVSQVAGALVQCAVAFPLVVFGSNAIVAYVAPILVKVHVLQEWTWPAADGMRESLQMALLHAAFTEYGRVPGGWIYTAGYILCWWLVLLALYRKRWFLRV